MRLGLNEDKRHLPCRQLKAGSGCSGSSDIDVTFLVRPRTIFEKDYCLFKLLPDLWKLWKTFQEPLELFAREEKLL